MEVVILKRTRKRLLRRLSYYGGAPAARVVRPALAGSVPLAAAQTGDRLQLDAVAGALSPACCRHHGLQQGTTICVLNVRPSGSVIFAVGSPDGPQVGVGAAIAAAIWTSHQRTPTAAAADPFATHLYEMGIGSAGRIVGYDRIYRGYMGKLIRMGLAPGVEFVLRCACSSLFEIELSGVRLALSKAEAAALVIEPLGCEGG